MKIFYVITHIEQLIGYTDNEYLYNLYMKQLEDWGIDDSIYLSGEHECKSEKEFLYGMGCVIHNTFRSRYMLAQDNKLISTKDYYSQNVIVLNKEICMFYEDKYMMRYIPNLIRKIESLTQPNTIINIYKYLRTEKVQDIMPIILLLREHEFGDDYINHYKGIKGFTTTLIKTYKYFKDRDCIRDDTLLISIYDIAMHWGL